MGNKQMKKTQFLITGMHCATCALNIEKKLKNIKGIANASVSFASNKAFVEYDNSILGLGNIKEAIESLGYKAEIEDMGDVKGLDKLYIIVSGISNKERANLFQSIIKSLNGIKEVNVDYQLEKAIITYDRGVLNYNKIKEALKRRGFEIEIASPDLEFDREKAAREKEINELKNIATYSFLFAIPTFILSLPFMLPSLFDYGPFVNYIYYIQFLLTSAVVYINRNMFVSGIRNLISNMPDMNSLVALGVGAAYLYSTVVMLSVFSGHVYFEIAALLLAFIVLGKYFETVAKGKTSEAIKKLIGLQPKTAIVLRNNKEIELPINEVKVGDLVMIKPGAKIPVDGVVISGSSSIDESMITGESMPVHKRKGDIVIAGTINKVGSLKIKATKIGKDTMLAQIIRMVEEAQASKPPIQKLVDIVAGNFVKVVIIIASLSFIYWYFIAMQPFAFAITIFVATLVVACPCAMGLATPTAVMLSLGKAAENGFLVKDASALEKFADAKIIVFDKTGTITKGEPEVTDIITNMDETNFLYLAASAEKNSEHHLANAILNKAKKMKIKISNPKKFKALPGMGITAEVDKKNVIIGNEALMKKYKLKGIESFIDKAYSLEEQAKTVVFVAIDNYVRGIIAISDTIKESSKQAIKTLKDMGYDVYMITGDNEKSAYAIAKQVYIDKKHVLAHVFPDDKANEVKKLQKHGIVAFVGDGINDAIALTQADVGIAIGKGTDIAIESAGIVLVRDDLNILIKAIKLSKYTLWKIKTNLFWAFIYNIIAIPIAVGLFYYSYNILLNPLIAGIAMALSSLSVVTNTLLMKGFKP